MLYKYILVTLKFNSLRSDSFTNIVATFVAKKANTDISNTVQL